MKNLILTTALAILTAGSAQADLSPRDKNIIMNNLMYREIANNCDFGFDPDYVFTIFWIHYPPAMDNANTGELSAIGKEVRAKAETMASELGGWSEFCGFGVDILNTTFGLEVFQ